MVRPIVRDPDFLSQKSKTATAEDLPAAQDVADTLGAHLDESAGMAAIMIGVRKRIIAVCNGPMIITMLNPKILSGSETYETEETCFLTDRVRHTTRYKTIRIQWQDQQMKVHTAILDGFAAETVQQMIDYCDGKLV